MVEEVFSVNHKPLTKFQALVMEKFPFTTEIIMNNWPLLFVFITESMATLQEMLWSGKFHYHHFATSGLSNFLQILVWIITTHCH